MDFVLSFILSLILVSPFVYLVLVLTDNTKRIRVDKDLVYNLLMQKREECESDKISLNKGVLNITARYGRPPFDDSKLKVTNDERYTRGFYLVVADGSRTIFKGFICNSLMYDRYESVSVDKEVLKMLA